jgi:hypothetical protein
MHTDLGILHFILTFVEVHHILQLIFPTSSLPEIYIVSVFLKLTI